MPKRLKFGIIKLEEPFAIHPSGWVAFLCPNERGISKMQINGELLKINGQVFSNLKSYQLQRNKLWLNSDRNMAGEIRATMIGIFPKIEVEFGGILTVEEIQKIARVVDLPFFTVEYFDPKYNAMKSGQFYAGDYSVQLKDKKRGIFDPFKVSLIPVRKEA